MKTESYFLKQYQIYIYFLTMTRSFQGDTNAGFWDTDSFAMEMNTFLGTNISREEVVIEAGDRCYGGLLSSFHMGGYSKVLAAIGDHELGECTFLIFFNQ